ncbi:hec ndc80p family protein [Cyclospora cayetanensis]|uniref:Kinetochore protein NDC80 n=1 Tax=Cyclospora cayetanensis TaxID=88456 RepID=A0A1D3CSV4_9EIME|nr:hec ndc80p family protein [Cyclospora cayetanensis]
MEPLIGGPTSPFRANAISAASSILPESQQPRELSEFSFYKAVNPADKALHSTYRRRKRSAEATKLKSLQTQDSFKRDALRTITRQGVQLNKFGPVEQEVQSPFCRCCAFDLPCPHRESLVMAVASILIASQRLFKKNSDYRAWDIVIVRRFLSFSEFPGPLSAKALSSPQRSLLIDIWGHLFRRCFDDSVKITAENVNDEVPRLFKEIGYPFPISKSAMLAPGTGHQWPHHLAALSWLCELLIYENEFFFQEEEIADFYEGHAAAAAAERDLLLQQQKGVLAEVRQLEERIKAQGIDKAEVEQIRHDISRLREGLAHRTKEIESLNEAVQALIDQVNECISSMSQLAVSVKLPTAEAWNALPRMTPAAGGAAAAADRIAEAAAAAAACDVKRAANGIPLLGREVQGEALVRLLLVPQLGLDWASMKKEMLRLMQLEEAAKEETHQQRQRAEREIDKLKKAMKDLLAVSAVGTRDFTVYGVS